MSNHSANVNNLDKSSQLLESLVLVEELRNEMAIKYEHIDEGRLEEQTALSRKYGALMRIRTILMEKLDDAF